MPLRQRSPTGGRANFYIDNCGDCGRSSRLGDWSASAGRRFCRAEKRSRKRPEQSKTDAVVLLRMESAPMTWLEREMLSKLRDDNSLLTRYMGETHDVCAKYNDVATTSLIEVWIDEAEGRTW
jgi:hypothetical protein